MNGKRNALMEEIRVYIKKKKDNPYFAVNYKKPLNTKQILKRLWKQKKLILIAFAAFLVLNGCKPKQSLIQSNTSERNDSTTTIIIHDTVINWLQQKQEVKTNQKSKLATDFSFSIAWIDSAGLLNHSIENFPKVPSKIIEKKTEVKKNRVEKEVKTLYITKTEKNYYSNIKWYGYFDIFLLAIVVIYLIYKIYSKFKI